MRLSLGTAIVAAVAALLVAPAPSSGQSLAELAKKEKERRKAAQGSSKTYTEDDLGKKSGRPNIGVAEGSGSEASASSGGAATTAPAEGGGEEGSPEGAASGELDRDTRLTQWRQEIRKADEDAARLAGELQRLQAAAGQDLYNSTFEAREQRRLAVEQAERRLNEARQKVDQLEAEGRRNAFRR